MGHAIFALNMIDSYGWTLMVGGLIAILAGMFLFKTAFGIPLRIILSSVGIVALTFGELRTVGKGSYGVFLIVFAIGAILGWTSSWLWRRRWVKLSWEQRGMDELIPRWRARLLG